MTEAPRCPRCGGAMAASPELGALRCGACESLWFPKGALASLLATPEDLLDPPRATFTPAVNPRARACPTDVTVCLEPVPYALGPAPEVERCPYCEGLLTDATALARMRVAARARHRADTARQATRASADEAPPHAPTLNGVALRDPDAPPSQDLSLKVTLATLPAALLLGLLARPLALPLIFAQWVRLLFHELGHAVAAWCCSWKALPLPIGLTLVFPGRSIVVFIALLAASGAVVYLGRRYRSPAMVAGAAVFASALVFTTWFVPERSQYELVSFAGCAGEFVVATLCVALFYARLPPKLRWDFWRWPVLALGAMVLVEDTRYWHEVAADWQRIPWGGLYDDDGDMTKLRDEHGWNELKITSRYLLLGKLGLAVSAAAWGIAVLRARARERASAPS